MHKFGVALLLLFVLTGARSQQPVFQWAKGLVTSYPMANNTGTSVEVDQHGNVFSAGFFQFTTDFDPGPGVFILAAAGRGNTAIYISKLSAQGDFLWAIQVPTLIEFGNMEISLDGDGNVYLASEFRDSIDMDPGPGIYMLNPSGSINAFVAKYSADGKLVWAKHFGGVGGTGARSDVLDIDNNNNVIICGNFTRTVDFDPGPGSFTMTSTASTQAFIVKLDNKGDFIWAKQFGNASSANGEAHIADVKCDAQGNIHTVGIFYGTSDFDPGPGDYPLQSTVMSEGYIAKLDPSGRFVWAKGIATTKNDYYQLTQSTGIDVDANNNVYTTGHFIGSFDFDPGVNTHSVTSNGYDWYVLKLNAAGDFVWVDIFSGKEVDTGTDVIVDNDGNVYTIGIVGKVTDMDPGPGVYITTPTGLYSGGAMAKLNSDGELIFAGLFDGDGSVHPWRLAVDDSRNLYVTGSMYGTIDFDPGPKTSVLSGELGQYPFVLKLGKCARITTSTINISTCTSYKLKNEVFDSSGTYIRTIPNSEGCDSIVTLNLTITKTSTEQTLAICEGENFFGGGAIQTTSGIYRDTLRTSLNCDSIVTTHLTVHPKPLPNLGADRDLCAGTESVVSPGAFTKYQWQDMTTSSDLKVKTPGLYWVKVTNNFSCSAADSLIVRAVLPSPANFLKNTDSICSYQKLEIRSSQRYSNYLWSNGSMENKVTIDAPGQYSLKVTDVNGCMATGFITVFKKECMSGVYVPSAFSPNNDGKNDAFKALVFGKLLSFKLQVFDRTGYLVFETIDPDNSWDGTNKGKNYSGSAFVWQCFYQLDQQKSSYQKGTVIIVR